MTQSRFSSVANLHCHSNLDLAAVANQSVSKRNATLPCSADEISQNLQKELLFSLINNHHDKVHPVMFFRKQHFNPLPSPPFRHYIRQWGMTTAGGLTKRFGPSLPLSPPTNEISCRGPCALLNVNKAETLMWYYSFSIFKYTIGCSSLYLHLILMYYIIFIWFIS